MLLSRAAITMTDITLPTLDGAGNNKKCFKILCNKMKVCGPHNLQRAVLYGLGKGGALKNPGLSALIDKNAKQGRSFNGSVKHSQRLAQAQLKRGVKRSKLKSVKRQHAIRWGGVYLMLRQNRLLESDIKVALTGVGSGVCEEIPAFVLPRNSTTTGASADKAVDSDGGISDADGDESDADQVEANERACMEFPLQHRCLGASDWKLGRQMESCLITPYECSQAMQGHQAVGLDKEYVLACATHRTLTADKVEIVSGNEVNESWDEVHADSLPADVKQFRRITAEQIEKRLLTLDDDTLVALKMNPSIDTSEAGPLFIGKSASLELMDAVGMQHG
ncbi:hypothetical protein CYMTET_5470 [Cymbomonas tetramitiformis]|uniref:Uncharacterized protein n=1 Tax=Cymbomonas tetramitiformis TaxID=36881 RepID=A0AAE0LJ13_9CHLO|nr:hypothetical protein CYMTET_5470 [Cymbomonas tetramitiformis]